MKSDDYPTTKVIILGVVAIILGLLSFACGIASATPTPSGNFPFGQIGYGIWGGVIYFISGIVGIITGAKATRSWILTHLVFSIFALIVALAQFSLGITAASEDYSIIKMRRLHDSSKMEDQNLYNSLNDYYRVFFPMTYQMYQPGNILAMDVYDGAVAVDAILASAGILMAIIATAAIAVGGRATCCRRFMMEDEAVMVHGHTSRI